MSKKINATTINETSVNHLSAFRYAHLELKATIPKDIGKGKWKMNHDIKRKRGTTHVYFSLDISWYSSGLRSYQVDYQKIRKKHVQPSWRLGCILYLFL